MTTDWRKHKFLSFRAAADILGVYGPSQIGYMVGQPGGLTEGYPDIFWGGWPHPPRFVTSESVAALLEKREEEGNDEPG